MRQTFITIAAVIVVAMVGIALAKTMQGGCCGSSAHHTCSMHHQANQ